MVTFRLIARLDIRGVNLIKTIRLEGVRKIGDPVEYARRYDEQGIDEIVFLDTVASLYGRSGLDGPLTCTSDSCFSPITVGGGIRSVSDACSFLRLGADKLAVNTAAIQKPALITELAEKFGSQAIVLQLDAKRKNGSWEAFCDGGRQPTGKDAIEWAWEAVVLGAGEIFATSIDYEGTARGCDLALVERVSSAVSVPVVASGGVGSTVHVVEVAQAGAAGVAMAGALHYGRVSLQEMRTALTQAGVPIR